MMGYIVLEQSNDPYHNLAYEGCLFDYVAENQSVVLYLWQNDKTVVVGRNQDVDAECDKVEVERNQINVARRKTGGGAVYHDLNNLNYSIILPKDTYNVKVSTGVIVSAMKSIGLNAKANERNDILVDEKKISGNAYYEGNDACVHHGTILYDVDIDVIAKVLTPSKEKLERNKVASVASRVVNIKELRPSITLEEIQNAVIDSFMNAYQGVEYTMEQPEINADALMQKTRFFSDEAWITFGDR